MLSPGHRIAYSITILLTGAFFIVVRVWIRNDHRVRRPQLSYLLSDVFVCGSLAVCAMVVILDTWVTIQRWELDSRPSANIAVQTARQINMFILFLKVSLFNQYAYIAALWCLKASFIFSYYNLSEHLPRKLRRALASTIVVLFFSFVGLFFAFTFWCRPINRNWTLNPKEFCSPQSKPALEALIYALHLSTVVPVMAIPLFILRFPQLAGREKYAVAFMFSLGILTVLCATFSIALRMQFIVLNNKPTSTPADLLGVTEGIYLTALAEVWGAVLVICLPSTRMAIRRLWSKGPWARRQLFSREGLIELNPSQRARAALPAKPWNGSGSTDVERGEMMVGPGGAQDAKGSPLGSHNSIDTYDSVKEQERIAVEAAEAAQREKEITVIEETPFSIIDSSEGQPHDRNLNFPPPPPTPVLTPRPPPQQ